MPLRLFQNLGCYAQRELDEAKAELRFWHKAVREEMASMPWSTVDFAASGVEHPPEIWTRPLSRPGTAAEEVTYHEVTLARLSHDGNQELMFVYDARAAENHSQLASVFLILPRACHTNPMGCNLSKLVSCERLSCGVKILVRPGCRRGCKSRWKGWTTGFVDLTPDIMSTIALCKFQAKAVSFSRDVRESHLDQA